MPAEKFVNEANAQTMLDTTKYYVDSVSSDIRGEINVAVAGAVAQIPQPMTDYEVQDIVYAELYTTHIIGVVVNNGSYVGNAIIADNKTAEIVLTPAIGYTLPVSITVTNASYTYDDTTGEIILSAATGDVDILANCVAA